MAFLFSLMETLVNAGLNISIFKIILSKMPLAEYGFSWLVPSIVGMIIGAFIIKTKVPDVIE